MDINIVWIIAVLLLAAGAVKGFRKGLVEGVVRITSYVIGIIVLIVLVKGIGSFIQGSILNVLMALILLVVIRLLHRIIKLLLDSWQAGQPIACSQVAGSTGRNTAWNSTDGMPDMGAFYSVWIF